MSRTHIIFILPIAHSYLGDAKLAGSKLLLILVHLLVALCLGALQLFAAFGHGLHFRLHLADVQTSHCELLVDHAAAALMLLHTRSRDSDTDSIISEMIAEKALLRVLYLYVVAAHSDADLSQVFEQRGHHLGHPLPLVVGHFLQLLKL